MAWNPTRVFGPAQPNTGGQTLHTAGSLGSVIKEIILSNTTALDATVTIGVGGVAAGNQIVPGITIKANALVILAMSLPLANTETLQGLQGTTGAITVTVSAEVKS